MGPCTRLAFFALAALLSLSRSEPVQADLPVVDHGIFSDLDAKIAVHRPPWLDLLLCRDAKLPLAWLTAYGVPVSIAPAAPALPICQVIQDSDHDGISDQFDILLGAKKAAIDAAPYGSPYRRIAYPLGDVPRGEGVCTDVVIRALRNAGIDLQQLLAEDIARTPAAYSMVHKANANIDHRRVKTLLPYFKRHWQAQGADPHRPGDWLPGDVVFMDTLSAPGPDHIGIVSDQLGPSGMPLIINSWTDGYKTSEMDLLHFVPVTHRFRAPKTRA